MEQLTKLAVIDIINKKLLTCFICFNDFFDLGIGPGTKDLNQHILICA